MQFLQDANPEYCLLQAFKKGREEYLKSGTPTSAAVEAPPRWNPYSFEGGTIAGISGEDFAVVASDTRMAFNGSAIMTRDSKKLYLLNDHVLFGGCMFHGDILALNRLLRSRVMRYEFDYREDMKADDMAEMLARNLYQRRFFPYYAWTVVGGIDAQGKGAVYSYDPVGCVERVPYVCAGYARDMMDPFFDNQIGGVTKKDKTMPPLTLERAETLMKDAFRAASRRETGTGDKIHMFTMVKGRKPKEQKFDLAED